MQPKKKNKKIIKPVHKPFLRGTPVDGTTLPGAAKLFLSLFGLVLANLLLGTMAAWDIQWLNILFNCALLLVIYGIYYQYGAAKGTAAVNQGEILHQRKEAGRDIAAREQAACYHPAKGFIIGILGLAPALVCCLLLAVTAQKQYTGLGALPSWIASLQRQPETAGALSMYGTAASMSLESVLRVIVRMLIMPFVNMVGSDNHEGLLLLERLSLLPMLLPGISYGIGYLQGENIRSRVHTDIAAGKRKRARKEKKRRQAQAKGPEQLN